MTLFLVVGDATLDVTVAPSRPLRDGGDVPAVIRVGPGGQGANVAVRLSRRGAEVTLAAATADDSAGRLVADALRADGVRLAPLPAARTSVVVALLDAAGERSMLSDRQALDAGSVATLAGEADWIHASGYSLLDDAEGDELARVLGHRPTGIRVSVAGGSISPDPAVVDRFIRRLGVAHPDCLLLSLDEATALLRDPVRLAREAASALARRATLVVVTAGAAGSAASVAGASLEVAALESASPILDATGAGDAFVACLIAMLADSPWPPAVERVRDAMERGTEAGAQAARVVGAQSPIAGERAATAGARA